MNRTRAPSSRALLLFWIALTACSVELTGKKGGAGIVLDDDRSDADDQLDDDGDGDTGDGDTSGDGDAPGDGDTPGDGDGKAPSPKSCGGSPHGAIEQRTRYPEAVVDDHRKCVAETQSRTCLNGTWSAWSGKATASECAVAALGVCRVGIPCAEGQCAPSKTNPLVSLCLRRDGAACSENGECVNRCIQAKCAEPAPAGGACDEKSDCSTLACLGGGLGGPMCKDARCVCPNESPCSDNAQCEHTCLGYKCADRNVGCDLFDQADCADDAMCSASGACVRNDGAKCTSNSQCKNFCIVDSCGPRSGFEGPCDEDSDCLGSFLCSPGPANRRCLRGAGATCSAHTECVSANCVCTNQACACAE